jgi:hypothetical protein
MYWNAWRQRDHLRLSPLETTLTLNYMSDDFGVACIGIIVCVAAQLFPPADATKACYFFFLIGVWKTIHGLTCLPKCRRLRTRLRYAVD